MTDPNLCTPTSPAGAATPRMGPVLTAPGSSLARPPLVGFAPGPHPDVLAAVSPEAAALADAEMLQRYPGLNPRPSPYLTGQDQRAREWADSFARNREALRQQQQSGVPPGATCVACQAAQNLCEIQRVTIQCGHPDRTYRAVVGVGANTRILEVIAGHTRKDKIKAVTTVLKPLCGARRHQAEHFRVSHNGQTRTFPGSECEFEVASAVVIPARLGLDQIRILWRNLWPLQEQPARYELEALACKGAATTKLTVRVYPQLKWEINGWLKVNSSTSARDPVAFKQRPSNFDTEAATGIAVALEAKCEYDGRYHIIGGELKGEFKESPTLSSIMTLTRYFNRLLQWAGNVTFTFPEVNLGVLYESEVKEKPNAETVTYDAKVAIGGYPLFGGTVHIELIDVILRAGVSACPGIGIVIAERVVSFLRRMREGFGSEQGAYHARGNISLRLSISAGIETGGEMQFVNGVATQTQVVIGGFIAVRLRGEASASGRVFNVSVAAGATFELAGADAGRGVGIRVQFAIRARDTAERRQAPFFIGGARFFGAKVEVVAYYEVKTSWLWGAFETNSRNDTKLDWELLPAGEWNPAEVPLFRKR